MVTRLTYNENKTTASCSPVVDYKIVTCFVCEILICK